MNLEKWILVPLIEDCLLLQALFLNILWATLFWGWMVALQKYPRDTFNGKCPSPFHWGMAFFVWAITFYVALSEFPKEYWFLGLAIANGALLSVLNPVGALCFSLSMILTRPWELMPANGLILEIPRFSMYFSIAWACFYFVAVDRFSLRTNRVFILVVSFMVWMFLSTFVTPVPAEAQAEFSDTLVRSFTVFFLIHHLARDKFAIWALRVSLVNLFTCAGLIALFFYFSGYREAGRIIAFGLFTNSNDIAAIMAFLFPLAATALVRKTPSPFEKLLAVFPLLVALLVIVFSQSRGALISIAISIAVFFYLRGQQGTSKFRVGKKTVLVGVLVFLLGFSVIAKTLLNRDAGDLQGSTDSRKSFWISGIRMAIYNPVFGVGFSQFPTNFENYAAKIVGEYGKRTAHSSWILALGEGGILGVLLFGAIFYFGAIRAGKTVFSYEPEWLCSAVCYGIAMTFLSHTYALWPYILVAIATAAAKISTDLKETKALPESDSLWSL